MGRVVDVVKVPHAFLPSGLGTMCRRPGCWGWVDDPRHLFHERQPVPPISLRADLVTSDGRIRSCPRGRRGRLRA